MAEGKTKKNTKKKSPKKNSHNTVRKPNPIPNSKPFPKGTSGNPNGRPRKLVSSILAELKAKGVEGVKPRQIADVYEVLFNLTIEEIKEKANDESIPAFFRIIAKAMLSPRGTEMVERMLDRAHGKARQSFDVDMVVSDNTLHIKRTILTKGTGN